MIKKKKKQIHGFYKCDEFSAKLKHKTNSKSLSNNNSFIFFSFHFFLVPTFIGFMLNAQKAVDFFYGVDSDIAYK